MIVVTPPSCSFLTGLFIGFERLSYTFDEPESTTPITEVALVTSTTSERRFITEISIVPGSATRDIGFGGDYEFSVERIIFDPEETRQIVQFSLNADLIAEGNEDFQIRATRSEDGPPYDCVSPCISLTTIVIMDDDRKCNLASKLQKCTLMPVKSPPIHLCSEFILCKTYVSNVIIFERVNR